MAQWRYRAIVMGENIESGNIYVCGYSKQSRKHCKWTGGKCFYFYSVDRAH